jgi:hypothetical protein
MTSKLFPTLATLVIAAATTSAFAVEATQFVAEASTKTRAEVQAQIGQNTGVVQYGEATVFVDGPATQNRALARSEAVDNGVQVVRLGEATQFIDQPGTRSRAEVRAETLASIRAASVNRQ